MTAKLFLTTLACGASLCLLQPSQAQTPPPACPSSGEHPESCPGGPPPAGHLDAHRGPGELLQHLTRELNLTEDQQAKIKPILEENAPLMKMIQEDAANKVKAVVNGVTAQIRPLLNSEQEKKLDAFRQRMEQMHAAPGRMGAAPNRMGGRPAGPMGGNPIEHLTRELNLTPEQQEKLKSIAESVGPQMKALHQDTAISPEDRHTKMKALFDSAEAQLRPLLTPEQSQKLDAMKAKWREHGPHQGQPPPPPQPPQ